MGKRLIIILISFIAYLPVSGQIESRPLDKGQNYIGLWGIVQHHNYFYFDRWSYSSSVRYGRYVFDKFAVGANINFYGYIDNQLSEIMEFVPFARYYILNKKISPVVEFHYNYALRFPNKHFDSNKGFKSKFNLGGGITVNKVLWNRLGVELLIYYGHTNYLHSDYEQWSIDGLLYLTYHFPFKK